MPSRVCIKGLRLYKSLSAYIPHSFVILALVVSLLFVWNKINHYEETAYDADFYTNAVDVNYYIYKSKLDCQRIAEAIEKDRCHNSVSEVAKRYSSALNLSSQDVIAKATRGILWITGIQAFSGFVTIAFLFWTVRQTRSLLRQAEDTTFWAKESLLETKRSNTIELQPYIKLVDVVSKPHSDPNWGGGTTAVTLMLRNSGATPARRFRNFQVQPRPNSDGRNSFVNTRGGVSYIFDLNTETGGRYFDGDSETVLLDILNPDEEIRCYCPLRYGCQNASDYVTYMYQFDDVFVGPKPRDKLTSFSLYCSLDFNNSFPEDMERRIFFKISFSKNIVSGVENLEFRTVQDVELSNKKNA